MTERKEALMRDAVAIFDGLSPQQQERAVGIMMGMMMGTMMAAEAPSHTTATMSDTANQKCAPN